MISEELTTTNVSLKASSAPVEGPADVILNTLINRSQIANREHASNHCSVQVSPTHTVLISAVALVSYIPPHAHMKPSSVVKLVIETPTMNVSIIAARVVFLELVCQDSSAESKILAMKPVLAIPQPICLQMKHRQQARSEPPLVILTLVTFKALFNNF